MQHAARMWKEFSEQTLIRRNQPMRGWGDDIKKVKKKNINNLKLI
jgi:hypothetical protein